MVPERQRQDWAFGYCLWYFDFPEFAGTFISGNHGQNFLWQMWEETGYKLYDSPWNVLRQEWYHAKMGGRRVPTFFLRLPPSVTVLDYGSGTAEMERLDWIEKGGRTILVDTPGPNFDYVRAKYSMETVECLTNGKAVPAPYDALVCTHVFEHLEHPIETLKMLWDGLAPGGQALLWFDTGYPAPGHLPEAIAEFPKYERFLKKHAISVANLKQYNWVEKPKRRFWHLWA